jgi:hypothetical protein
VYAGGADVATPGANITDASTDAQIDAAIDAARGTTETQAAVYPTGEKVPLLMNASLTPALNRARIAELENQGMTELGREYELTDAAGNPISPKEWYRQDMERQLNRKVDPAEVKSGIVTRDGQQLVSYALKDPETEILKAIMPGAGGLALLQKLFGEKTGDQQVTDAINIARGGGGSEQQQAMSAQVAAPQAVLPPYKTELSEASLALPSTSGMTAEQWAAANTGGDMSKVHARIKFVNGAPQLEYYTV